jgi:uncharacterized membrane protein
LALIFMRFSQADVRGATSITAAAFVANLFESWLGATAQGRFAWLTNDAVNILQITVASAAAMLFATL